MTSHDERHVIQPVETLNHVDSFMLLPRDEEMDLASEIHAS